jgi:cytochrome c5
MRRNKLFLTLLALCGLSVTLQLVAQQTATEAPAGFSTPQVANAPGSQSMSNGVAEPPGDTFALDQAAFETIKDVGTGLGPLFNASSCSTCHASPVSGAASQMTEIRIGHLDDNGNFVNPVVTINDGQSTVGGRSLVNDRAICAQAEEHVPDAENIRTLRAVLNTLGDGFVEAIDDQTLTAIAQAQPGQSNGLIQGEVIQVPVLEAPGQTRVARKTG